MANYNAAVVTNQFHVTDEARYQELYKGLSSDNGNLDDFTEEDGDGRLLHCFGSYSTISYYTDPDDEDCESDIVAFFHGIQEILPEDEVFIIMEAGHEKLRYVDGSATVCSRKGMKTVNLLAAAADLAEGLLGKEPKIFNLQ